MSRKWTAFVLAGLLLALCGCSLARAEAKGSEGGNTFGDRFAGVYLYRWDSMASASRDFYSNPNLTEYGSDTVKVENFGSFDIPRQVLFAEKEGARWVFPGLEGGYSLFELELEEEYGHVSEMNGDMAPGEENNVIAVKNGVNETILTGTAYFGPPLGREAEWDVLDEKAIWEGYKVYQAPDGRPYLDGSGNSFSGGGGFGFTYSEERTVTENGEAVTERMSVKVQVEEVSRLEKLVVTQFNGKNNALRCDDLALREELPEVHCEADAAWVLVEEIGRESTVRTAYTVPGPEEEAISHMLVLLDDDGLGRTTTLQIQ